jgi:hypothetical protein
MNYKGLGLGFAGRIARYKTYSLKRTCEPDGIPRE